MVWFCFTRMRAHQIEPLKLSFDYICKQPLDNNDYICKQCVMTDSKKQISIAESKVMEVLWQDHPLTAEDIHTKVASAEEWSTATVKTLLNRLLSKEAISAAKDGRRYLYSPELSQDDYISGEGQSLVDRLFDGRISGLVTHFSKHQKLDANDISDLKKIIAELEDDSR